MDETDSPQNRSNDEAELSKSSDEHSFMGKVKFGVSKILTNSLSKWLSPKVDITTARRRRHEEMESDDEDANRNNVGANRRHLTTPQLAAPPPNKKKKTFTEFLGRNTLDLDSPSGTPLIGERSNIISSTLIEDVPHRTNNKLNRFLPLENGQHANDDGVRDNASNYPDEGSSSQSRDKPTNPFAINNDSSVVNFSAHLQRAKSLFTNRSYISPRLKNYRMRNPRSSLYRSTSSLCDNNSVSSNASSAMSSPFYNGQTTFGGASATSRRVAPQNPDLQMLHRPKIPTNLVTSRSTSSLNTIGGSANTSMSNTARRILDVMSKYNTPLTEVRRISNALPSIAETSALNKRKSILDLDATTNEIDKTKRLLMKPNTPYNRPFGRNPIESVLTTELHVPSMPELLQLKKFANNTMKIRDIANKTDSVFNKPAENQYKMVKTVPNRATDGDLDASNNNKFVNNKNDAISNNANDSAKEHKGKIRSNITKRKMGKPTDNDTMPEPVDLPNIPLMMDKKAALKFSEPFKLQNMDQKAAGTPSDNGVQIPFKFKSSNTNSFAPSATKEKRTNGNDIDLAKKFDMSPSKPAVLAPVTTFSTKTAVGAMSDFSFKQQQPAPINSKQSSKYQFAEPIIVNSLSQPSQHNHFASKSNYKFSEPTYVGDKPVTSVANKTLSNFKFESKQIRGVPSDSGFAETTHSFGTNANKSTGLFASSSGNGFGAGKSVSSATTKATEDDTFKSLVAKQKQDKWECNDCMAPNNRSDSKCACCGAPNKTGSAATAVTTSPPAAAVDDVFKSIVAKQKQSKWECTDCMTQNDQAQPKCLCCGQANPKGSSNNVTANTATAPPKPTFSFGTLPSTATSATPAESKPIDSVFKSIVDKQKSTWECSACLSANDVSKSKCACCEQSRDVTTSATNSGAAPTKSQFSFGSGVALAPKSTFSFGSNPGAAVSAAPTFSFGSAALKPAASAQISFGNPKSAESTTDSSSNGKIEDDKSKDPVQKAPAATFSFGSSAALPSTSKVETTPAATAPIASDNMFKSIVAQQKNTSWECSVCMTKNKNDAEKCACCETGKDGTAAKKEAAVPVGQKFSFGSQSGNTFSFGSKPEATKPTFQFGNAASSTAAVSSSTVTSTTQSVFGSAATAAKPTFSFGSAATAEPTKTASLAGFQFSFNAPKVASKDETDAVTASSTQNKGITVLDNVVVKPATNGPTETPKAPMFSFGQSSPAPVSEDIAAKATKRANTDQAESSLAKNQSTGSSTPFIFGAPQGTANTFGGIATTPQVASVAPITTPAKPTFAFGMGAPSTTAFPTVQPTSFSFNAGPTTTAASSTFGAATPSPALTTPSQPTFGSNAFSAPSTAVPALGGFKAAPTFGSSVPAFGTPSPSTEAHSQASSTPSVGLFQFGASAPPSAELPKPGGFNFSMSAAPTSFNFSESAPIQQQANVPFQFGAPSDTPNIFSAAPSATASATAIQQRRKVRVARRTNRP